MQHNTLPQSEQNLIVLSVAFIAIREKARRLKKLSPGGEEFHRVLLEIESIADSLHNVGSMMAKGQDCDARVLYRSLEKEHWPTGIEAPAAN